MIIDVEPIKQSQAMGHWLMCFLGIHVYEKQHIGKRTHISGDAWLVWGEPMKVCKCCHKTKDSK